MILKVFFFTQTREGTMELELKGKKALVTGGSKGIGYACAKILAAEGCGTIHLAARNANELEKAARTLSKAYGTTVLLHPVDLSKGDNVRTLAADCTDIDILVNNAGAIPNGDLQKIDEPVWREAWDLKVFGYINLCRAVYPAFKARGKGVIINIIGAGGEKPSYFYIAGGAGNASLMAFTRALGSRSHKNGIRVVAVNPGLIKTQRLETQMRRNAESRLGDADRWQELLPDSPPPGDPEDIGHMVAFLASDRAKNINATVITVDGGSAAM